MIKEIEADARQFGDERRTLIEEARRAVLETRVVDEPVTVIISQKGWLRARQGHGHDPAQFTFKMGDRLYDAIECRSTENWVALSNTGRVYTVAVSSLPSARGDGQPITTLVDLEPGSRIVHMVAGPDSQRYFMGTQAGYGFIAALSDMTTRQRAGKQFVTLDPNDVMLKPLAVTEKDKQLAMLSESGRCLVVDLSEFKVLSGGGRGTQLMGLDSGDTLSQWAVITDAGLCVSGIYRNRQTDQVLAGDELAVHVGKRARKGKQLATRIKNPVIRAAA
jgi:topoisomerase-4 subunit A